MITHEDDRGSMTDWVGSAKAAKVTQMNVSNVFRNAMAGRIALRVKEKHLYYLRNDLARFDGAPRGKPSHTEMDNLSFSPAEREKFKELREELEDKYEDVIYQPVVDDGNIVLQITVYRNGRWQSLPPRKLSK